MKQEELSSVSNDQVKVYSSGTLVKQGTVLTGEEIIAGSNNVMRISAGGTANSTILTAGWVTAVSGGIANETVCAGNSDYSIGRLAVSDGGIANSTVVNRLGRLRIGSNGIANNTTINSGADIYVESGGIASNTVITSSGFVYIFGGGTAINTVVNAGGGVSALNEGVASDVTINNSARLYVSGGGYAQDVYVNSGGLFRVYGEEYAATADDYPEALLGSAKDVTIYDQGSAIISGGEVTNLLVSSGGFAQVSGVADVSAVDVPGSIHNGEIKSGGSLTIANGTQLWGATILGGTVTVTGSADVYGELNFNLSERTVNDTFIVDDITGLNVYETSFYSISVADDQAEGTYQLAGNAANFNQTISIKGEVLTVNGESVTVGGQQYTLAVTDSILTLTVGTSTPEPTGNVLIYSGDTLVKQGDYFKGEVIEKIPGNNEMRVINTGLVENTTFYGGRASIYDGGKAIDTIMSGGTVHVSKYGNMSNTTIYGGYLYVGPSSAYASNTIISGGSMNLWHGSSYDTEIFKGHLHLMNGGVAVRTTLHSGTFIEGGWRGTIVSSAIVNDGAYISVSSNAVVKDTVIHSAGYLEIEDTKLEGTIQLGGNMLVLNACTGNEATVDFLLNERTTADAVIIDNIANLSGVSYTVTVADDQAEGTYQLAGNAANFNQSISIKGETLTVNGNAVTVGGQQYSLAVTDSILTLTVGTSTPEPTGDQVKVYSSGTLVKQGTVLTGEEIIAGSNNVMRVFDGGTANSTLINSSGYVYVSNGGVANDTLINGYNGSMCVYSGGFASNTSMTAYGRFVVYGSAEQTTLTNGNMTVCSGGIANNIYGNASRHLNVYVSGTATNAELNGSNSNGTVYFGHMLVKNSGFAGNVTANAYGGLWVSSGGVARTAVANKNGTVWIKGGGFVQDVDINAGGVLRVLGEEYAATADDSPEALHGSAKDVTIYDQGSAIISGGEVTNLLVSSGGFAQVSGVADVSAVDVPGSIHNGEIKSGGSLTIANGTQLWGATILGGTVTVTGSADVYGELNFNLSERTVNDTFIVDDITGLNVSGTSFYSVTVADNQAYGTYQLAGNAANFNQTISIKGETLTVNGNAVTAGGQQYTLAVTDSILTLTIGAAAPTNDEVQVFKDDKLVKQGTVLTGETIIGTNNNKMFVYDGGTAKDTLVNSNGFIYVSQGGLASNTTLRGAEYVDYDDPGRGVYSPAPGSMGIFDGGIASNTHIYEGGRAFVSKGGTANEVMVYSHGNIWARGKNAVINGITTDKYWCWIGADKGGTINDLVNVGGSVGIFDGGTINNAILNESPDSIHAGLNVYTGGVANNTTINGTYAWAEKGATLNNLTLRKPGWISLQAGSILTGKHVYGGTVAVHGEVDASNADVTFNISERTTADRVIINDITYLEAKSFSITVSASQAEGAYKLAGNAADFSGTLTIGDGTVNYGSLTVNGNDLVYNNVSYSLDQVNGNLTLTIGNIISVDKGDEVQVFKDDKLVKQGTVLTGETIVGTNNNKMFVYDGGTAKDTLVDSNGFIYVSKGGLASNTTLRGAEYVDYDDPGRGVYSPAPGSMGIFDGGIASNTHIYEGGRAFVSKGGTANEVMVYSHGNIWARGKNAVINNITTDKDWCWVGADKGGTINDLVNVGGSVGIFDGGTLNNAVQNGDAGMICVYNGGVANNTTVNGAYITAYDAAALNNLTLRKPGMLILQADAILTGKHVYGGTVRTYGTVDASNADVTFNISERKTTDKVIVDDIANLDARSFSITVSASQAEGAYKLAGNAANFSGTLTIGDGTITYGSLTVNGATLTYNDVNYTLVNSNSELALHISGNVVDIIPPDAPIAIADITTPTNCNVTVTAVFAPDAVRNEYTINGSDWFIYDGGIIFTDNGSVSFRSADEAGNVSAITTYVVSNIDKIAPDAPVVTVDEAERPVESVTVIASSEEGTIEYSFDGRNYQTYDDALVVTVNGEIFFRTVDDAGNVSEVTSVVIDNIDHFSDPVDSEYNFIKKSFSTKINGKTQNGIVLEFGKNAFSRLEDATGTIAILLDSKTTVSTIPANIEVIAGNADTPDNRYNFNSIPSRTVTISGINAGDVEFLRFATVSITDGAVVSHVIGGKESASETVKTSEKKGVVTETVTYTQNTAVTGKAMLSDAAATLISGYSTVTLDNSTVENLLSTNVKNTENEKYIDNIISTVSRTETCSASGSVTLKNNSEAGFITGFNTVKITQSQTGDITRGEAYTQKYSLKDGEESTTKTFSRSGSLTASDAGIGDISGFATVKLTGTDAGDIELGIIEKITDDEETIKATGTLTAKNSFAGTISGIAKVTLTDSKVMDIISSPDSKDKLSGSVTMTGSTAGNVENYSTLTLSGSIVSDVSNVNKVTAKSGFNAIASYTGSDGNDTLTINKNAVLALGTVDMGAGAKDKFVNNGTLVLTCDFDRSFISGKGEIVAASDVYETLENQNGVLDLGATAEGFRTTKHENSDDTLKKAVKWDLKSGDYTGWLGSWQSGSDNVDFIKFTIGKNDVDKELCVSGVENFTLFDKKGNEVDIISAAGTYTLKLELDSSESTSYTLALA